MTNAAKPAELLYEKIRPVGVSGIPGLQGDFGLLESIEDFVHDTHAPKPDHLLDDEPPGFVKGGVDLSIQSERHGNSVGRHVEGAGPAGEQEAGRLQRAVDLRPPRYRRPSRSIPASNPAREAVRAALIRS